MRKSEGAGKGVASSRSCVKYPTNGDERTRPNRTMHPKEVNVFSVRLGDLDGVSHSPPQPREGSRESAIIQLCSAEFTKPNDRCDPMNVIGWSMGWYVDCGVTPEAPGIRKHVFYVTASAIVS